MHKSLIHQIKYIIIHHTLGGQSLGVHNTGPVITHHLQTANNNNYSKPN